MGLELARAYINIQVNSNQVESGLRNVENKTNNRLKSFLTGASGLLVGFGMFAESVFSTGMQAAAEYERITIELTNLTGSAEKASEMLEQLTAYANETPLPMDRILSVARQLVLFGESGKDVMKTIQMLGNVSAGEAKRFSMVGLVFNQIRGVGHLITQDFRQLSTRGIIALSDFAKHFGKTLPQVADMLRKGKISFEDVRQVMTKLTEEGGRFHGLMEKQSKSLAGLGQKLNDVKNMLYRLIVTPLMPWMKALINSSLKMIEGFTWIVKNSKGIVSFALAGAGAFAVLAGSIAAAALATKLLGLSWTQLVLGGLSALAIIALGAALGALVGWISQNVDLMNKLADMWRLVQVRAEIVAALFKSWADRNYDNLMHLMVVLRQVASNITEVFMNFFDWLMGKWDDAKAGQAAFLNSFLDRTLKIVTQVAEFFEILTAHPKLMMDLIAAAAEYAFTVMANWAMWAWNQIKAAFFGGLHALGVVFMNLGVNARAFGLFLVDVFKAAAKAIFIIFVNITDNIVQFFGVLFSTVKRVVMNTAQQMRELLTTGFIWTPNLNFADTFKKELAKTKGFRPVLAGAELGFEDAFSKMKKNMIGLGTNVGPVFEAVFNGMKGSKNPLAGMINVAKGNLLSIWEQLKKQRDFNRLSTTIATFKDPEKAGETPQRNVLNEFDFKPGRYSFAAFGESVQDALLKDKDNIPKLQLKAALDGNAIQNKIFEQGGKTKGGLGP